MSEAMILETGGRVRVSDGRMMGSMRVSTNCQSSMVLSDSTVVDDSESEIFDGSNSIHWVQGADEISSGLW